MARSKASGGGGAGPDAARKGGKSIVRDAIDLVACAGAIYGCYLAYGVAQERIFTARRGPDGEQFRFSAFLVFVQCIVNGALAAVLCACVQQPAESTPRWEYFKISASYIGAMFASNAALSYVTYPTQALAKSCKMIPVMLMRIVVNKKRYRAREYLHVLLITAGISTFMLMKKAKKAADPVDEESNGSFGLVLLFLSLALDGFTGPNQERIEQRYKPSTQQMMLHMNVYAVFIVTVGMLLTGTFMPAVNFVAAYPAVLWDLLVFSLTSALGQNFILMTLYRFDSLILTTITTTRKFFTILVSVVWFGHHLNAGQWAGVAVVFFGLGLDAQFKYAIKRDRRAAEAGDAKKSQ